MKPESVGKGRNLKLTQSVSEMISKGSVSLSQVVPSRRARRRELESDPGISALAHVCAGHGGTECILVGYCCKAQDL